MGAKRFSVGNQAATNAIRIATCSPESATLLQQKLESIRSFIAEEQKHTFYHNVNEKGIGEMSRDTLSYSFDNFHFKRTSRSLKGYFVPLTS